MKIEHLRYFNQLAKVLSYTNAAKDLYIAQPTLSSAIRQLEKELGFQLFERGAGSSHVALTSAGAVLQEYTETALNTFDAGLRLAYEMQGAINSEIRVGTIYAMQGYYWSQAMQAFSESVRHPPKFIIEQTYSVELISRLRKGELDVAFAAKTDGWSDLRYVLVWSQPLVLCVNKAHPFAKRKSIDINELIDYELLTYAQDSPPVASLKANLDTDRFTLLYEYDDEITLSALVSSDADKMALFCYTFLVNAFENVVCLPVRGMPFDFHKVYLASRKETHPKVVEEFIQFMSAYSFPNAMEFMQGDGGTRAKGHRE